MTLGRSPASQSVIPERPAPAVEPREQLINMQEMNNMINDVYIPGGHACINQTGK